MVVTPDALQPAAAAAADSRTADADIHATTTTNPDRGMTLDQQIRAAAANVAARLVGNRHTNTDDNVDLLLEHVNRVETYIRNGEGT